MLRTAPPSFLRALLVPWTPASVLFIAFSAALLALFSDKGVIGIVGSYFLLSWLFKYAFVVLEHVANGHLVAPVASVEMLGPFEQRPLILVGWCLIIYAAARTLGSMGSVALLVAVLSMLPATVAVLGLGLGPVQSVNPLTLWRTMRGLGFYYLGILAVMAVAAALIVIRGRTGAWNIWTYAVTEVAVLTTFSMLGGALFERRLELGFEPMVSPERRMEKEEREHARRLNTMLDYFYAQMRINKHEFALEALRQWLAQTDEQCVVADAHRIIARVAAWNDSKILSATSQALLSELEKRGMPEEAREISRAV
jgi:hypothetical protein